MTALDHVLLLLIPLFLRGAGGNEESARQVALRMLEAHDPVTDRDYLLAAELIACSITMVDSLCRSMEDPDMAVSTRLRLRANGNALSARADRNRKILGSAAPLPPRAAESAVAPSIAPSATPSAIQKIRDAIVEAAPNLAETLTNASQTMSRQQRRLLSRQVEQARAARERDARKAARFASRAAEINKEQLTQGAATDEIQAAA
jgi:hypothetical protein